MNEWLNKSLADLAEDADFRNLGDYYLAASADEMAEHPGWMQQSTEIKARGLALTMFAMGFGLYRELLTQDQIPETN